MQFYITNCNNISSNKTWLICTQNYCYYYYYYYYYYCEVYKYTPSAQRTIPELL